MGRAAPAAWHCTWSMAAPPPAPLCLAAVSLSPPLAGQHAVPLSQDGPGHQGRGGAAAHAPTRRGRQQHTTPAHCHLHRQGGQGLQVGGFDLKSNKHAAVGRLACSLTAIAKGPVQPPPPPHPPHTPSLCCSTKRTVEVPQQAAASAGGSYFASNGVQKAVLLARYTDILHDW